MPDNLSSNAAARLVAALSGSYRIDRQLGAGGMATVYLAHDIKHDRKVAIKVLRPELAAVIGAERFLAEIRTTANLQHPHILALHDSGETDGFLFYVMPFIDGESLRDRLDREQQLPVEAAMGIVREVADALDYAHRAGVVHRDIKPENILLSDGHAVVADFGIARAVTGAEDARLTQTGQVVGTPAYLSPEQVTGEPVDGRSDLYSLGCVLYECLAGELPFGGPAMAMLAQRVISPPPSVRKRRGDVPAHVDQVLLKAMATQSTDRFSTCRELMAAFNAPPAVATGPDRRSMVVLPFVNQIPDPDNEIFSDGLTEEIIADLARVKGMSVLSRTSSMRLKGTTMSIRTLGRELNVRYALSGSVRRAGNSLRITAELIDATTDTPVWAEKFSGTMDDVFDVQERVAREIVKALGITLSADENRRLTDRPITSVRAFELFLHARQAMQRYQLDRGAALLAQAIAIEGEVPALRALRAYGWFALVRMGESRTDPLAKVEAEAAALIADAPDAAYGHALRGFASYERGDLPGAVRSFRAALARDPNDAEVLFQMGISLQAANRNEEAATTSSDLTTRDPLSPFADLLAGANHWFVGAAADGIAFVERALTREPDFVIAHWALGYNYALANRMTDATREAEWMLLRAPHLPYTVQLRALVNAAGGRRAEALERLRAVDWAALDAHHTFHLSESFAMAGDLGQALELFERAVDNGFYPYDFFATHCPFLAPLRGLPEFHRILAKAGERVAVFGRSVP